MRLAPALCLALAAVSSAQTAPQAKTSPPRAEVILVDRDDLVIDRSCTLETTGLPIEDKAGDGLVKIVADGVTVQFTRTPLFGAASSVPPDELRGVGVRVLAKNVTLRGGQLQGFKAAIWATGADGLLVEGFNFSNNFRQHLRSTPAAEASSDWLWPHQNDRNEWLTNYGAAIYVEESTGVTLRSNVARSGQNGICLRRVDGSAIHDNDLSFLSGWGLAMFRSNANTVDHNSFDFCVRGYSHGVYSRGQDSAGILVFEQCSDNLFAFNSATHSGDGFFGFTGVEALEGANVEHRGLGCNRNRLHGNDFSYAPAIGIEMTFSFDNVFDSNKLVGGNYGVWGGYSQRTSVVDNDIAENTISGVAVEHGRGWRIAGNRFARNNRGIELWWDDDKDLLAKPWAKANGAESAENEISSNEFEGEQLALELRGGARAWFDGSEDASVKVDEASRLEREFEPQARPALDDERLKKLPGTRAAVGGRPLLAGRDKILVTEWGPYDHNTPLLWRTVDQGASHVYQLLGGEIAIAVDAGANVKLAMDPSGAAPRYVLTPRKPGGVTPYELKVRVTSGELSARGLFIAANWKIGVGGYQTDPREDAAAWRKQVEAAAKWWEAPQLVLRYGNGGASELGDAPAEVREAKLPRERFGTLATTQLELPAGRWKLATTSDDGVRVRVDGKLVIDNWTHHVPTVDSAELELAEARRVALEVEHFELDGYSTLEFELTPIAP